MSDLYAACHEAHVNCERDLASCREVCNGLRRKAETDFELLQCNHKLRADILLALAGQLQADDPADAVAHAVRELKQAFLNCSRAMREAAGDIKP